MAIRVWEKATIRRAVSGDFSGFDFNETRSPLKEFIRERLEKFGERTPHFHSETRDSVFVRTGFFAFNSGPGDIRIGSIEEPADFFFHFIASEHFDPKSWIGMMHRWKRRNFPEHEASRVACYFKVPKNFRMTSQEMEAWMRNSFEGIIKRGWVYCNLHHAQPWVDPLEHRVSFV